MNGLSILPVAGLPEIRPGDRVGKLIAETIDLLPGDVVVVTQKIVSKAEGRIVALSGDDVAAKYRLVESESRRILRRRGELVISETHHGFVCATAGIDLSNVEEGYAVLLPVDPDRSARRIRDELVRQVGAPLGVVISDTFGRPWRRGLTDIAIGCAGVAGVLDLRGETDSFGRVLLVTEVCVADEIAGAAELVMGKSAGIPVAVVRGAPVSWLRESSVREEVVRSAAEDLFR